MPIFFNIGELKKDNSLKRRLFYAASLIYLY